MSGAGMTLKHIFGLTAAAALTLVLFYASRFWIWKLPWSNDGLFGQKLFTPWGNVVHWWVQGTPFADMSLIIWGCGAIIALSIIQRITALFSK